jgi:hypothetical protein
MWYF